MRGSTLRATHQHLEREHKARLRHILVPLKEAAVLHHNALCVLAQAPALLRRQALADLHDDVASTRVDLRLALAQVAEDVGGQRARTSAELVDDEVVVGV